MTGEPYLTADRLEDFREQEAAVPFVDPPRFADPDDYAKARRLHNRSDHEKALEELRSRQTAILQSVHSHAEWCASKGFLDLTTISRKIISKSEAATLTADCVEDALLTMLDERTQRELREVE